MDAYLRAACFVMNRTLGVRHCLHTHKIHVVTDSSDQTKVTFSTVANMYMGGGVRGGGATGRGIIIL